VDTTRRGALAIVGLLAIAGPFWGCGDDEPDEVVACTELFADGVETPNLVRQPTCFDAEREEVTVASSMWPCGDDKLFANEFGYGIEGEPWRVDAKDGEYGAGTPLADTISTCEAM